MRLSRRTAVLLATVAATVVGALAPTAARAEEAYSVPASGYWDVRGHGWGHGVGMSQWGAQGAAQQGLRYDQILDFYYPGTTMSTLADRTLRVRLMSYAGTGSATFWAPPGQTLVLDIPGRGYSRVPGLYTVRADATGFLVDKRSTPGGPVQETFRLDGDQVEIRTADGAVAAPSSSQSRGTWYRGSLRVVRTGATTFDVVNHVGLEHYLYGVVPRESPSSWRPAALQAQAVAARSYALSVLAPGASSDICDTTQCQVYSGRATVAATPSPSASDVTRLEADSTNVAIDGTRGQVRTYQGAVAFTQFSASNGGYSRAGSKPYLVARPDPYSGAATGDPVSSWTNRLTVAKVQQKCPAGGSLRRLVITSRDGRGDFGGRITGARLECSTGSVNLSSSTDLAFGMRSNWWLPTAGADIEYGFFLANSFPPRADVVFGYGDPSDTAQTGDWDGNGTDTPAIRRGATFYVRNSNTAGMADTVFTYGNPGDELFVGDWDGNGTDTLAIRRGSRFYVRNSVTSGVADTVFLYGDPGDEIFVGDWDNNGTDTFAVRRGHRFYVRNSLTTGVADLVFGYGNPGDAVLVGDWDGNGTDTFTVRRGATYYVSNSNATGVAEFVSTFGNPGDTALAGDWNGDGRDTLGLHRRR